MSDIDSVEEDARNWTKREKEEVDTLSEWVNTVRSLIQIWIKKNSEGKRAEKATSVFKDPEVAETLSTLQDKCVVVPADKASNNLVLICKKDYR